jgi:hypothetical protein
MLKGSSNKPSTDNHQPFLIFNFQRTTINACTEYFGYAQYKLRRSGQPNNISENS